MAGVCDRCRDDPRFAPAADPFDERGGVGIHGLGVVMVLDDAQQAKRPAFVRHLARAPALLTCDTVLR